jgi:hypothetical protein
MLYENYLPFPLQRAGYQLVFLIAVTGFLCRHAYGTLLNSIFFS